MVSFGGKNELNFGHVRFEMLSRLLVISVRCLGDRSGKNSYSVGGEGNWYSQFWEQFLIFNDSTVSHLGVYMCTGKQVQACLWGHYIDGEEKQGKKIKFLFTGEWIKNIINKL